MMGLIATGGVFGVLLVVAVVVLKSGPSTDRSKGIEVVAAADPAKAPEAAEARAVPASTPISATTETATPVVVPTPTPVPTFARAPSPAMPVATTVEPAGFRQGAPDFAVSGGKETPADTVKRIKDAAVFIKVKAGDEGGGSGSGFVIRTEGTTALIATNHHVIGLGKEDDEPDPKAPAAEVTVVFRSGTPSQAAVPARIIATDRVGTRDLAILRVEGVPNLPKPIALDQKPELNETMPVLIYGFPFGEMDKMLSHSNVASPGITINKGSISSLRRNEHGEVTHVQIDGSLNPGNSGGPVVDEKGRLVGVAVAQIRNTTIGFAVPAMELTRMLDGRVGRTRLTLASRESSLFNLDFKVRLIDPMKRIRSVQLLHGRADAAGRVAPNPDGSWSPIGGAQALNLMVGGETAGGQTLPIATGVFQIVANVPTDRKLMIQLAHVDTTGKTIYSAPESVEVPEAPGMSTGPKGGVKGEVILSAVKLGDVTNSKDCTSTREGKSITIHIPGTVHILSPELKKKNAPMMVGDIEGDFVARVRIPADFSPGTEPVGKLNLAFHGAGLLLWKDANNYLRLERTAQTGGGRPFLETRLLLEGCTNGRAMAPIYAKVPDGPVYLQIVRWHNGLHCMLGPDGDHWIGLPKLAMELPDKIKVGISAGNTSRKAFAAKFEEFTVIKPEGKVEGADD